MFKQQSLRHKMLQRIRDFGSSHQALFPSTSAAGQAFAAVAEAVNAIDRQSAARLVATHAGKKTRVAARKDVRERLMAIFRTVRFVERQDPTGQGVFKLPARTSDDALLTAAHAVIDAGEAVSQQWVPLGLPETAIADLRTAVAAFEQGIRDWQAGKNGRTMARVNLEEALDRGFTAALALDVIVANTPQLDPAVLAVWRESRRVHPKSDDVAHVVTPPAVPAAVTTADSTASPPKGEAGGDPATDDALRQAS